MHLVDGLKSAFISIGSHKLRSALTLTGIVIGVIAVVTMFSSVYALKTLVSKNMEGLGWNNSVIVIPNMSSNSSYTYGSIRKVVQKVSPLNYDDYLALRDEVTYQTIYGKIESTSKIRRASKEYYVTIRATENSFFTSKFYGVSKGRFFNSIESSKGEPVAIIGYKFASEQFGNKNPIGEVLVLGSHRFIIIGVLGSEGMFEKNGFSQNTWARTEDMKAVYVPLCYGAYRLGTSKAIHEIFIQAKDKKQFSDMKTQTRRLLLSRHNMYPNFRFMDLGAAMLAITEELNQNMKKWNITLSAIASISLIVGGIGLFSTLLISIQERMSEIGIRKSIGATEGDIFFYFMSEALALAFIGSLVGVGISWGIVILLGSALKFPLYMPMAGVLLGTTFSLLIGFISGLYPALKAAKVNPISAIYYHE